MRELWACIIGLVAGVTMLGVVIVWFALSAAFGVKLRGLDG